MTMIGIVNKRFEKIYFFSSPTFRAQLTEILAVSAVGVGGQAAIELPATAYNWQTFPLDICIFIILNRQMSSSH